MCDRCRLVAKPRHASSVSWAPRLLSTSLSHDVRSRPGLGPSAVCSPPTRSFACKPGLHVRRRAFKKYSAFGECKLPGQRTNWMELPFSVPFAGIPTCLPFYTIPHRYTVRFEGIVFDRPFGHALRRLDMGETIEVVDWWAPFVRLANDAGFVLDADFDGHLSKKRWAKQKSGTVLRLHNLKSQKPNTQLSPRASGRRAQPSTTTKLMPGLSPDSMCEDDLKSEVSSARLLTCAFMPQLFLYPVSHLCVVGFHVSEYTGMGHPRSPRTR